MFPFWKKAPPKLIAANPGINVKGSISLARAGRSWNEYFDTVDILASVLEAQGHRVKREKTWLVHPASGYILLPQLVNFKLRDQGGIITTTTIQTNHPVHTPHGIFEHQHGWGDNTSDSIHQGFEQWAQVDFVPLLDALQPQVERCMVLKLPAVEQTGQPKRLRRVVLGPVAHYVQEPAAQPAKSASTTDAPEQCEEAKEHTFCPCCLFTNSFTAFKELIESDSFYGVRLYAARDSDGNPQADCRVNGENWAQGAEALINYVKKWPAAGFEFRKQYVVLQSIKKER